MTWTWGKIVSLALFRSGLVGAGQIPTTAANKQGFDTLELLLDELDGEGLALPDYPTDLVLSTVANEYIYYLGQGNQTSAIPLRPEQIISAEIQVSLTPNSQPVWLPLQPLSFKSYKKITVPSNQGQPQQWAINQKWPQSELYLWPNPNQVYQIRIHAKVKWASSVGDPECNPCAVAEIQSGYVTALVDVLALKLAENNRLETSTLQNKASKARFLMTTYVAPQIPDVEGMGPDAYSWNIIRAGSNP